jgi:hypothetical protein
MSKDQGMKLYTDADMVDAVFAGEEVRIPKKWVGTEYADGYVFPEKDDDVAIPEGDPVEAWTAKQLDAYADREGIDLSKVANKKAEKLAAILDAKTTPPPA